MTDTHMTDAPTPGLADAGPSGRSASGAVFGGILQALDARRLVPGQRLVEVDLAASFGVSRNSVREALHRLAGEGIVDLLRHKGAAIRLLSLQETLDVLDVAERMTGLLARAAARQVAQGAQQTAATALAQALKQLTQANTRHDAEGFAQARRDYYRSLLELAGNRELRRLFPAIQMPIVYAQYRLPGLQQIRLRDYRAIAREVLAGDEAAADQAAMAHVRNVREEILRQQALDLPRPFARP